MVIESEVLVCNIHHVVFPHRPSGFCRRRPSLFFGLPNPNDQDNVRILQELLSSVKYRELF